MHPEKVNRTGKEGLTDPIFHPEYKKAVAVCFRNSLFQCANVSAKAAMLCFASNRSIHLRWTVSPSLDLKETGLDESIEPDLG